MTQEVTDSSDFLESFWEVTGKKPKHYATLNVQLEVKSEKYEQRLLIATEMRLYLLKQKPLKLETSMHYGDLTLIKCLDFKNLTVGIEGKQLHMSVSDLESTFERILSKIFSYFSISYGKAVLDKKIPVLEVSSRAKEVLLTSLLAPDSFACSPCGNLSAVYMARCDQLGLSCFDDVAWDIDATYNAKDTRHFDFADFDHLPSKHLVPLLASFEHNQWFSSISLCNFKLTPELAGGLLRVLKRNCTLQHLDLACTGIKSDFMLKLTQALSSNTHSSVNSFDLSNNPIDDKGVAHLVCYLSKPTEKGLVSLNLAGLSLTYKTISLLADCFQNNAYIRDNLTHLNLSNIPMKGEENVSLHSFLAQSNNIESLKLTNTEYPVENLFAAALRGCSQKLQSINLSSCLFSRRPKDTTPDSWRHFFSSVAALTHVDLSNTKLPSSALFNLLEGLESNSVVTNVTLNLSGCQLGQSQNIAQVFHQSLPSISKLKSLDLSDNGLEHLLGEVFKCLAGNKHLKELSVGRNIHNCKPKVLTGIMEAMVAMLQHQQNGLERLCVDALKMRQDAAVLFNSLVSNTRLFYLDISGNQVGEAGMKSFSKALVLNRSLTTVLLDNNQLTHPSLTHLANALDKNTTLKWLPVPLNDMMLAPRVSFEKFERTWKKIEACLHRNQTQAFSLHRQAFALEQWVSNSFEQGAIDTRLELLASLLEQGDALKLKRKTSESLEQQLKGHYEAFNACKRTFFEAKQLKKLFLEAYAFCDSKKDDDAKFISQLSTTILSYLEWLSEEYDESVKEDFSATLVVNSADGLLQTGLTKEEGSRIRTQVEELLQSLIGSLKFGSLFDRSRRFNDLLLNSAPFTVEKAICNAKGICIELSNQMIEEGLMGDQEPEYVKLKRMIDVGCGVKEVKKKNHEGIGEVEEKAENLEHRNRRGSNKVRRPLSNYAMNFEFSLKELEDLPTSKAPSSDASPKTPLETPTNTPTQTLPQSLSAIPPETKAPLSEVNYIDLDALDHIDSTPPLTHLAKDRPRRIKTQAVTRVTQPGPLLHDDEAVSAHRPMHTDVSGTNDKLKGRRGVDTEGVTTTSSASSSSYTKNNKDDELKIPLPVIRMKNKPPELPATRPKYIPKTSAQLLSVARTDASITAETAPSQAAPTPMRRHMMAGNKGILMPSMQEIKEKRNSMRHVSQEMALQPSLVTPVDKTKRLTDFSVLKDDSKLSEKKTSKPVPPLPPKPFKAFSNISLDSRDDSTDA